MKLLDSPTCPSFPMTDLKVYPNRELGLGLGHHPWVVYGGHVSLVHGVAAQFIGDRCTARTQLMSGVLAVL